MSILTEKEREDVYKYWLHSSTLNNEDGLIQLAERAVLEKLTGMELPEPFGLFCGVRHDPPKTKEFWGMLNEGADNGSKCNLYTADQLRQAYAQGAASVLSAEPSACIVETSDGANMVWPIADLDEARTYCAEENDPVLLYTLKTAK